MKALVRGHKQILVVRRRGEEERGEGNVQVPLPLIESNIAPINRGAVEVDQVRNASHADDQFPADITRR